MAIDLNADYVLVGPDGSRALIGQTKTDPDWVGYMATDQGGGGGAGGSSSAGSTVQLITGLDDPDVRENVEIKAQADGGNQGSNYYGTRPVTLQGMLIPDTGSVADLNARWDKLKKACNAMRADATLTWTETGSVSKRLWVRKSAPMRETGQVVKAFFIALRSARAEILSADENSVTSAAAAGTASSGLAFPLTFPLMFALTGGITQNTVVNNGTTATWPRFVITGPALNPSVLNNTTGESLTFSYNLLAGDVLVVDCDAKTVTLNGVNKYSLLTGGTFWAMQPGSTDVRLNATTFSSGAGITIYWRDAWI